MIIAEMGGSFMDAESREISVDCMDLFGDPRVELLLHISEETSDGGDYYTRIYTILPGGKRYALAGEYTSGLQEHDDIERRSLSLLKGPEAVTENGAKKMKLMYSSIDRIVEGQGEDGSLILAERTRVWEEIHELKNGKLHLARTTEISSSRETVSNGSHYDKY